MRCRRPGETWRISPVRFHLTYNKHQNALEIEAAGEDGRSFSSIVKPRNSELEPTKKTEQVRLTGPYWDVWAENLKEIRRNPSRAAALWDQKANKNDQPTPVRSRNPQKTVRKRQVEDPGDADSPSET